MVGVGPSSPVTTTAKATFSLPVQRRGEKVESGKGEERTGEPETWGERVTTRKRKGMGGGKSTGGRGATTSTAHRGRRGRGEGEVYGATKGFQSKATEGGG